MPRYRYRKRHGLGVLSLVLLSLLVWHGQQQHWFGLGQAAVRDQPGLYSINHFIDGDTISVNMNGKAQSIRFIGVDTPETHKPNTPVECYGPTAAAFTNRMIGKQRVRLVSDSLSTDYDRYGRLLRYVYLPGGQDLNELLIQQGYGFYYPYFPFSKQTLFKSDEQQAIAKKLGLWSACKPTPSDDGGYKMNEIAR